MMMFQGLSSCYLRKSSLVSQQSPQHTILNMMLKLHLVYRCAWTWEGGKQRALWDLPKERARIEREQVDLQLLLLSPDYLPGNDIPGIPLYDVLSSPLPQPMLWSTHLF